MKKYAVADVHDLMLDVFIALGVPEDDARICADVLIESDLRGIESHGIGRLKMYYDRIRDGIIDPVTRITKVKDFAAAATWDGNNGLGQVIAFKAMNEAISKAGKYGLGAIAVRNSNHYGIAGFYPLMAARRNMIGMTVTNARPSMAPTFGVEPLLGTNPIAFSAPSDEEFDFLFDAATPISQRGNLEKLARAGQSTPAGWVIDENARPLTDTNKILNDLLLKKASFLPLGGKGEKEGGHKGYGLATMVEILSAALQSGSFMQQLSGMDNGRKAPYGLGHFFLAISIEAFTDLADFRRITGEIMRQLQNSTKAPGQDRIYVAGEKEYLKSLEIREKGISLNGPLLKNISIMIEELGLEKQKRLFG